MIVTIFVFIEVKTLWERRMEEDELWRVLKSEDKREREREGGEGYKREGKGDEVKGI